jgi:lysyl-tRNA synthetase class 2
MENKLSEQEIERRSKLEELRKIGINPFPAELFEVSHYSQSAFDLTHKPLIILINL